MAKVSLVEKETNNEIRCGDFVIIDGEIYMVSQVSFDGFLLIGIKEGNRWDDRTFGHEFTVDKLIEYVKVDDEYLEVRYIRGENCEVKIFLE